MKPPAQPDASAAASSRAGISTVTAAMRAERHGHPGLVVWLTGLSGAGKTTLACELERRLFDAGFAACLLDGDLLRRGLCSDLGFSAADRRENIRRVGELAAIFAAAGSVVICAFISPYRDDRNRIRRLLGPERFFEVYVNAPIAVCEQRDVKGHYARARAGLLKEFTGVSAPYEPPLAPEIEIRTDVLSISESTDQLLQHLLKRKATR